MGCLPVLGAGLNSRLRVTCSNPADEHLAPVFDALHAISSVASLEAPLLGAAGNHTERITLSGTSVTTTSTTMAALVVVLLMAM